MLRENNHRSITFAYLPPSLPPSDSLNLAAFSHSFLPFSDSIGSSVADWKSIGDHHQFIYCNRASRNEEEEEEEAGTKRVSERVAGAESECD